MNKTRLVVVGVMVLFAITVCGAVQVYDELEQNESHYTVFGMLVTDVDAYSKINTLDNLTGDEEQVYAVCTFYRRIQGDAFLYQNYAPQPSSAHSLLPWLRSYFL